MTTLPAYKGRSAGGIAAASGVTNTISHNDGGFTGTAPAAGDTLFVVLGSSSGTDCRLPTFNDAGWRELVAPTRVGSGTMVMGLYARTRGAEAGYSVTWSAGATGVYYKMVWYTGGKAAISDLIVGTPGERATSGGTVLLNIPGITTTVPNTLALCFAVERTVATESAGQVTVNNGFTVDTEWLNDNANCTSHATHKNMAAAAATGQTTLTYPNSHAQNARGVQVGLLPVPDAPTGLAVKVSDGTQLKDSRLMVSNGSALYTPRGVRKVPFGYPTVTAMLATSPYVAHRGGSRDFPEMSLYAYGQSAIVGYRALELSLARTSDGVWFGLHDDSLDRTSLGTVGSTLLPGSMTWAQVQTYQILGSVAPNNTGQPNRPYMRWEELMAVYYRTHVIFVDPKVANAYRGELMTMMNAMPGNPRERFVGKYYGVAGAVNNSTGWARELSDNGYQSWGYFYSTDSANFATYAPRWSILGMDYASPQGDWDALRAVTPAKMILGHICPTQVAVTTALSKGANGVMVSGVKDVVPPAPTI